MNGNVNVVASLHWLSFPRVSPPCCRLSLSSSFLHLALLHFLKTSPERNPLQRRWLLLPFWFREPEKERTEEISLSIPEAGSWSVQHSLTMLNYVTVSKWIQQLCMLKAFWVKYHIKLKLSSHWSCGNFPAKHSNLWGHNLFRSESFMSKTN